MRRSRRSILFLLTVLCGAGVLLPALPAQAGGLTCSYNAATHTVGVNVGGIAPVTIARNEIIITANGAACVTGFDTATVAGTDTILINGDGSGQDITIDLGGGRFAPGFTNENGSSDEIEFVATLNGGLDTISIAGTSGADNIRVGEFSSAYGVNLNANESRRVDADLQSGDGDLEFILFGNGGKDVLSATGGRGTPSPLSVSIQMSGGGGDDRLTGGDAIDDLGDKSGNDADVIKGGEAADLMFAVDGDGDDVLDGQSGADVCDGDPQDTTTSCAQPT